MDPRSLRSVFTGESSSTGDQEVRTDLPMFPISFSSVFSSASFSVAACNNQVMAPVTCWNLHFFKPYFTLYIHTCSKTWKSLVEMVKKKSQIHFLFTTAMHKNDQINIRHFVSYHIKHTTKSRCPFRNVAYLVGWSRRHRSCGLLPELCNGFLQFWVLAEHLRGQTQGHTSSSKVGSALGCSLQGPESGCLFLQEEPIRLGLGSQILQDLCLSLCGSADDLRERLLSLVEDRHHPLL